MRTLRVPLLPAPARWAGVLAVAAVIAYLSVVAAPPEDPLLVDPTVIALDKWRHFLAYAGLGGALAYATADWQRPRLVLALGVIVVVTGYGLGIEGVQALQPDRYFTWSDATANAIGGLFVLPWFAVRPSVELVAVPRRADR